MTARFVVSQLGARMHYAVPRLLHRAGLLERLYTDICATQGWPRALHAIPAALRPAPLVRLLGRRPVGLPPRLITSFPRLGLAANRRLRAASTPEQEFQAHLWIGPQFCRRVADRGFGAAGALYAFSGAALEQLEAARACGLRTVLEQIIAPHRVLKRLLLEEAARYPHWSPPHGLGSVFDRYIEREEAEWRAADLIVCGSDFVRDGIAACGGPVERCVVVPYGVDHRFRMPPRPRHGGALRVLVVGEVGLRKGSPYVLEAARALRGVAQVRMVGPTTLPGQIMSDLASDLDLLGPVPRSRIHEQFAWADVFLLPSLCEGSATVTYEALASGLPVVCTPNTGSVVRHGIEGLIVPPRDTQAIVEAVAALAGDRAVYEEMAAAAVDRAGFCTIDAYGERLLPALTTPRRPTALAS